MDQMVGHRWWAVKLLRLLRLRNSCQRSIASARSQYAIAKGYVNRHCIAGSVTWGPGDAVKV
jgi:hypothetical protein